jgi:hypothetical protein
MGAFRLTAPFDTCYILINTAFLRPILFRRVFSMSLNVRSFCLAASLALVAPLANAATFQFDGSPSVFNNFAEMGINPGRYNPSPGGTPLVFPLIAYKGLGDNALIGGGLRLNLAANETATVTYTVLGEESGFINRAVVIQDGANDVLLENQTGRTATQTLIGATFGSDFLDFVFRTNLGTSDTTDDKRIRNGGRASDTTVGLGFSNIAFLGSKLTGWLHFDDSGAGPDDDYDDMVVGFEVDISRNGGGGTITPVPEVSATGSLAAIASLLALMALLWERRTGTAGVRSELT